MSSSTQSRPRPPLRILAADLGGTNARFAECRVGADLAVRRGPVFRMDTRQPGATGFPAFWSAFLANAPAELADTGRFDAIALGLAGSVQGAHAVLPNIDWNIGPGDIASFRSIHLLNDFVAQGYGLAARGVEGLTEIRAGDEAEGVVAVVGAGTGLGHCALHPRPAGTPGALPWIVAGSEAGHAVFPFVGGKERDLAERMAAGDDAGGSGRLDNDDVVSGPGAARLHRALTGQPATPAEALSDPRSETRDWFARFYARACRNFCLNVFPVRRLVLSGGIAARHPDLVRGDVFRSEFEDAGEYRARLARIPIWLNTDTDLGIDGAAVYAALRITSPDAVSR